MKMNHLLSTLCLSFCLAGVAAAEEKAEPKPEPDKKPVVKPRPAIAAPVRILGGGLPGRAHVELTETGPVVRGTVDKSEVELSYTKDEMVRLSIVRSYSLQDPELAEKYPHLHKQLENVATPMVEEKVLLKVEAKKEYKAESLDALTKEHPKLAEEYAQYFKMFESMAAFKGRGFGGAIRVEARPAVPIRPARPRRVEPKRVEPQKAEPKKAEDAKDAEAPKR